ncbi:PqqD family protein [Prevotella falsenii]|uniref:PqqD family protein n=1 Tax=Prevotella falsenii TaxID=515414 RepID=UPI00046A430A|nr:PqqD family protein [Prevotella falsenii]
MKTKIGFNLRQVCGENIIVAEGEENIDFSNIISMNESSAFLWKEAQQLESFTIADLVRILTDEYEVDEATATEDVTKLTAQWGASGILEGDDIPVLPTQEATEKLSATPSTPAEEAEKKEKKGFFKKLFG